MRVFVVPAVYAAAGAIGLVAGLVGDGPWDWVSWLALSAPLIAIAQACWRPRAGTNRPGAR